MDGESVAGNSLKSIIWRNLSSPIFLIILILVVVLIFLRAVPDAAFLFSVIFFNTLISTVQEIKAKWQVDRLALLNSRTAQRRGANGLLEVVPVANLVAGDEVVAQVGEQLPVDGVVQQAQAFEVNEALLTGEAQLLARVAGDQVFAGSLIAAGEATIRVSAVGLASRVGRMNAALKARDRRLTPLQHSLNRTIGILTGLALVMMIIIIINGRLEKAALTDTIITVVTAAISLVPEGLLLASSLLLAYSAVRMARSQILAQRLAAIEGFGRLEYLCVDKTGTLTSAEMEYQEIIPLSPDDPQVIESDLAGLVALDADRPIMVAVGRGLTAKPVAVVLEQVHFTPERKYSALKYRRDGQVRTVALGALEALIQPKSLDPAVQQKLASLMAEGRHILLLAAYPSTAKLSRILGAKGRPLALVVLRNHLRPGVPETIASLQRSGVKIRVISGDSLATAQAVALDAGIHGARQGLSGEELELMSQEEWQSAITKHVVFGRISPEQKRRIISAFHQLGYTGMIGDGINDALALRQADLGIAMAEGSQAARDVADVVILDNSFAAIPRAVGLASEYIMRLEQVGVLFFNRITYGLVILIFTLSLGINFPYLPRQVTMMNWFVVALPTVFWSFQAISPTQRRDPDDFFRKTLRFAIPNGLLSGLAIGTTYLLVIGGVDNNSRAILAQGRTVAIIMAITLGVAAFVLAPRALGMKAPNLIARQLAVCSVAALAVLTLLAHGGRIWHRFFGLFWPTPAHLLLAGVVTTATILAQVAVMQRLRRD